MNIYIYIYIYSGEGLATDENMAHARCILDNLGYKRHSEYVILIAFPL